MHFGTSPDATERPAELHRAAEGRACADGNPDIAHEENSVASLTLFLDAKRNFKQTPEAKESYTEGTVITGEGESLEEQEEGRAGSRCVDGFANTAVIK